MSITETTPDLEVAEHPSADTTPADRTATPGSGVAVSTGRSSGDRSSGEQPSADRPTSRPSFTITDAATACAVSRKTITRKLPELALSGAAKDDDGIWRIPVEALLAVGLHPGRSVPEEPPMKVERAVEAVGARHDRPASGPEMVTIPRDRWDDVRIRLARAEAEAAERALALADARLALRALTAGPNRAPGESGSPAGGGNPATAPGSPQPSAAPSGPIALGGAEQPAVAASPGASWGVSADAASDLFSVRSQAARSGAYVAVPAPPLKKRRWWQSL